MQHDTTPEPLSTVREGKIGTFSQKQHTDTTDEGWSGGLTPMSMPRHDEDDSDAPTVITGGPDELPDLSDLFPVARKKPAESSADGPDDADPAVAAADLSEDEGEAVSEEAAPAEADGEPAAAAVEPEEARAADAAAEPAPPAAEPVDAAPEDDAAQAPVPEVASEAPVEAGVPPVAAAPAAMTPSTGWSPVHLALIGGGLLALWLTGVVVGGIIVAAL